MSKADFYKLIEDHYRKNYKNLVNIYSGKSGGGLAEDVIQEAYTRALQYWDAYEEDRNFENWFSQIIHNCLRDTIKEERMFGMVQPEEAILPDESVVFNRIYLDDIRKLMSKQGKQWDYVLNLFFFKEYEVKEISEVTMFTPVMIRYIVFQFRKKLRNTFGNEVFV